MLELPTAFDWEPVDRTEDERTGGAGFRMADLETDWALESAEDEARPGLLNAALTGDTWFRLRLL